MQKGFVRVTIMVKETTFLVGIFACKMERASKTRCFPRERNHQTPPLSSPFRGNQKEETSGKSERLSLLVSVHLTFVFPTDIWRIGAKRTRLGTDGPVIALEPCPLRNTTNFQSQLTTSFRNANANPFSIDPHRCRHQAAANSNHCGDKILPNALCSLRLDDHGSLKPNRTSA